MPIECQTGLPGEGKTLVTLDKLIKEYKLDVEKNEQDPDHFIRPVYYYNVKLSDYGQERLPHWTELNKEEIQNWFDLPDGSKILIDECQEIFRPLKQGADKPLYYSMLEKHRHKGYDLFLITQSIKLIDMSVRELVSYHGYIERRFNSSLCTLWVGKRWQAEEQLKKDKRADERTYKHNKEVFKYYSSAQMHTIKTKVPLKLKILIPLVGFSLALGYFAFQRGMSGFMKSDEITNESPPGTQSDNLGNYQTSTQKEIVPDTLLDGVMKGRKIFITGLSNYGQYFNVNGVSMRGYDLKALGYSVSARSACFAIVNKTPVTCAPPDYWGEEYDPYDPDRNKRKTSKKKDIRKKKKKEETEEV